MANIKDAAGDQASWEVHKGEALSCLQEAVLTACLLRLAREATAITKAQTSLLEWPPYVLVLALPRSLANCLVKTGQNIYPNATAPIPSYLFDLLDGIEGEDIITLLSASLSMSPTKEHEPTYPCLQCYIKNHL